jgi:ABC-type sulfate transport system permease component
MEYTQAHALSAVMVLFSFIVLLGLNVLNGRRTRVTP